MPGPYSLVLTGQCLIKRDVHYDTSPGFAAVKRVVRAADHAFTNFEGTLKGRFGGEPTKTEYFSAVPPTVLDSLKDTGFDLLSLCNNHALDYGPGGVLSTLDEIGRRGFAAAGAGHDLNEAAQVGYLRFSGGTIALVAMDCGPQDDRVYARNASGDEPAGPGINPMRLAKDSLAPDSADLHRNLAAVTEARTQADLVIVYTHSHHWAPVMWHTPEPMAALSRGWIDAGADIVLGHGTPAFQGIEIHRGKPIFHGLGNFIFHSWRPQRWLDWVGVRPWQGLVATCAWSPGVGVSSIQLVPICIGHDDDPGDTLPEAFHDVPVIAPGAYGSRILDNVIDLSRAFGTEIRHHDDTATLTLA